MKIGEAFWVYLISISIAAVCLVAIIVIAVKEKKRSGHYPSEVTGSRNECGWFSLLTLVFLGSRIEISSATIRHFPLCIIYPGLDLALSIAYIAIAAWAISYAFKTHWHWRVGMWIAFQLILPAMFIACIAWDIVSLYSISWVWIPAAIIAIFAAPFFTRFAYREMVARGNSEPDTSSQPDFRLWRS